MPTTEQHHACEHCKEPYFQCDGDGTRPRPATGPRLCEECEPLFCSECNAPVDECDAQCGYQAGIRAASSTERLNYITQKALTLSPSQRVRFEDVLVGALVECGLNEPRRPYVDRFKAAIDRAVETTRKLYPDDGHDLAQVAGHLGIVDLAALAVRS